MLGLEAIKRLQIDGDVPKKLDELSFSQSGTLWKKQKHHIPPNTQVLSKKYAYVKIGKTLGMETTRYLSLYHNILFYYEEALTKDYLGYCCIDNVYVEWFSIKSGKYLLLISNGSQSSLFYFDTPNFWNDLREEIVKHAIQMDFGNNFEVLQQLGEGSFSKVYLASHKKTGKYYAAKMIYKFDKHKNSTKKLIIQEKKVLNMLGDCEFTYKFNEFYEMNDQYVFLMEYVPGKDLMTLYKQGIELCMGQIRQLFSNILLGLKDCHSKDIIHRDMKPQNIIVDIDTLKLKIIDFGLSLHVAKGNEVKFYKRCGTMGYMAPEVFANHKDQVKPYTSKCDLFSFGIIVHMILLGYNPLKGKNYEQTYAKNKQCRIELNQEQIVSRYGQNCLNFIKKLLIINPKLRYTAQQALNSPFLRPDCEKQQSQSTLEERRRLSFEE